MPCGQVLLGIIEALVGGVVSAVLVLGRVQNILPALECPLISQLDSPVLTLCQSLDLSQQIQIYPS